LGFVQEPNPWKRWGVIERLYPDANPRRQFSCKFLVGWFEFAVIFNSRVALTAEYIPEQSEVGCPQEVKRLELERNRHLNDWRQLEFREA